MRKESHEQNKKTKTEVRIPHGSPLPAMSRHADPGVLDAGEDTVSQVHGAGLRRAILDPRRGDCTGEETKELVVEQLVVEQFVRGRVQQRKEQFR